MYLFTFGVIKMNNKFEMKIRLRGGYVVGSIPS